MESANARLMNHIALIQRSAPETIGAGKDIENGTRYSADNGPSDHCTLQFNHLHEQCRSDLPRNWAAVQLVFGLRA